MTDLQKMNPIVTNEFEETKRNLSEAIKVRKMLGELKQLRKERKI